MSGDRKRISNRANAKASTGPRTALGKLHARKNAYRHGLSVSIFAHAALSAEVEDLALEIAGAGANSDVAELARRVAEAQIDLARVRKTRHDLLSREFNDPTYQPRRYFRDRKELGKTAWAYLRQWGSETAFPPEVAQYANYVIHRKPPQGAEKLAYILSDFTHQLIVMDRYERRALSRRKFAIRAFDLARQQAVKL